MKRVGTVERVAQGLAIARCPDDDPVDIGTMVVDERLNSVGRVVDVFGPVTRPYLAVSTNDAPTSVLGDVLYSR